MWRELRNFKDPADVLGALSALAMTVFFGALLLSDEDDRPRWLLLPALVIAALGFAGELTWKYVRRRRDATSNDA